MFKIALKDLKLFFKDGRALSLTFALPIALITLFAFAFGGVDSGNSDKKLNLLVSDLDRTDKSQGAIQLLDTLQSVQIKVMPLADAEDRVKKGNATAVLILHKGFTDSLTSGNDLPLEFQYDEANQMEVGLLQQALIPTIAMFPFKLGSPKISMSKKFNTMVKGATDETKETIQEQSDNLFESIAKGIRENKSPTKKEETDNFFGNTMKMTKLVASKSDNVLGLIQAAAGTAVMMLLFSVVGIGSGLLDEKQEGTLKRLLYTPINPIHILFGKMFYANIVSVFQLVVMFVFTWLVFGLKIGEHIPSLIIIILATAFACSAFGVLLASFATSRGQVQGLSTLIILVMSAIGGSMIPLFIMPKVMQQVAVISVNYWSIQGFYDIFWRNLPIYDLAFLTRVFILILIGVVLNGIAVVMFKKNILKFT